jgi:hypothetical protein
LDLGGGALADVANLSINLPICRVE